MGRIKLTGGSGNGQNVFLKQPTSAQITLKNTKNQDVKVKQGEFIYLNHPSELWLTNSVIIDRTTPVQVVGIAYSTEGNNGGRKLVRLINNNWLIAVVYGSNTHYFYKSMDDGVTWSQLCYSSYISQSFAITSYGTNVYLLFASTGSTCILVKFDATTVTNTNLSISATVDSGQTVSGFSGCSIIADSNGHLHAVFASTNATRPNSSNIRYSKSIDGGNTWSAITLITTTNISGDDNRNPTINIMQNGHPIIVHDALITSVNYIRAQVFDGTTWTTRNIYNGGSYTQMKPSVTVDTTGVIHVAWRGRDISESYWNIRYSKSSDNGTTWSTMEKLTNGPYNNYEPSISSNINNQISIAFHGTSVSNPSIDAIRMIQGTSLNWGAISNIHYGATASYFASICDNHKDFEKPLTIFLRNNTDIAFYGKWSKSTQYIDAQSSMTDTRNIMISPVNNIYTNQGDTDGGRLLTRLSNGWLIAALFDSSANKLMFYKSSDNGQTWAELTFFTANTLSGISIASYGTNVYTFVIDSSNTDGMWFFKFDATTVAATNRYGTHIVVSTGTNKVASGTGWSSMTVGSTGNIHIAYSIKDVTYSGNFNVRYAVSTNGGTSFTTTQITKLNDGVNHYQQPQIVVTSGDIPLIVAMQYNTNNAYGLYLLKQTGLTSGGTFFNWTYSIIYSSTLLQYNASAIIDSTDIVHVAWRGYDATEGTLTHIRYCKSTSTTYAAWTTMEKLTTGAVYFSAPSIVVDASNNISIMTSGSDKHILLIRKIASSWLKEKYDTGLGKDVTCAVYKNFTRPLAMWKTNTGNIIRFFGEWDTGSTINNDKAKLQASGEGILKSFGTVPKHYVGNIMKQEVLF